MFVPESRFVSNSSYSLYLLLLFIQFKSYSNSHHNRFEGWCSKRLAKHLPWTLYNICHRPGGQVLLRLDQKCALVKSCKGRRPCYFSNTLLFDRDPLTQREAMDSRSSHSRSLAAAQLDHDQNLIVEGRDYQADAEQGHQSLSHQRHSDFAPLSFETSDSGSTASTSLSDIIEGLPTAVKSSLGPLMTIRRSVSIRGWVSYFYEISTNSTGTMGTTMSQHAEHHTVMSTSTTTEVEMQQQGQGYQSNQGQKRRRASVHGSTKTSSSTEMIEYVEPRRRGIDRFSALQGKSDFVVSSGPFHDCSARRPSAFHSASTDSLPQAKSW